MLILAIKTGLLAAFAFLVAIIGLWFGGPLGLLMGGFVLIAGTAIYLFLVSESYRRDKPFTGGKSVFAPGE